MEDSFSCGFIFGIVTAGTLGFILTRIRESRMRMRSRNRPLDTFPDSQQSNLTPGGIVRESNLATVGCLFWIIVLAIAGAVLYLLAIPWL